MVIEIFAENIYSYYNNMSDETEKYLSNILSYNDPNFYYKQKYLIDKMKSINTYSARRRLENFLATAGKVSLLDTKRGRFPSGLLGTVILHLEMKDIPYIIHDRYKKPTNKVLMELGENFSLYPNQQKAFDDMKAMDFRCILNSATAFGKTHVGLAITAYLSYPTLVVVPTITILNQWVERYEQYFKGITKKKIGSGIMIYNAKKERIIFVSTMQLLVSVFKNEAKSEKTRKRNFDLQKFLFNEVGLLIFDEVHLAGSDSGKMILSTIPSYYRIGLTGSFGTREDNRDLEYIALIGERAHYVSPSQLIEMHRAVKIKIKFIETPYVYSPKRIDYPTMYQRAIINNPYRNNLIIEKADEMIDDNRQVLILVDRIDHAKILSEMSGYEWTDSSDSRRMDKFDDFKKGVIPVLICTVKLVGVGFDMPPLSGMIIAGSGKSTNKFIQAIGRVMRLAEGKTDALIIDFADNTKYFRDQSYARLKIYKREVLFDIDVKGTYLEYSL